MKYLQGEAAGGVMFTLSHTTDQHLHLPVDPSPLRPVQDALLHNQQRILKGVFDGLFLMNVRLILLVCYLVLLLQFGDHDDGGRLLLPRHLPEVVHRVHHGALRGDESLLIA